MEIFVGEVCSIYYVGPLCLRIIKICFFCFERKFLFIYCFIYGYRVKLFRSRDNRKILYVSYILFKRNLDTNSSKQVKLQ